ncbi:hypothetical protein B0H11DRAFT_2183157 [Mycena galericulata]|nr:hypothetical protein B0H11DRAFT_2183157 [Mycena galericulata]
MRDTKYKTPTCSRCRARKMRCNGLGPCNACSSAGTSCAYEDDPRHGLELRKGAACLACRRKKKKCNGEHPCRTCAASRKTVVCEYPDAIASTSESGDVQKDATWGSDHSPLQLSFPWPSNQSSESSSASGSSRVSAIDVEPPVFDPPQNAIGIGDIHSPGPFTASGLQNSEWGCYVTGADLVQARDLFLEFAEGVGLNDVDIDDGIPDPASADEMEPEPWVVDESSFPPSAFFQIPDATATPDSDEDELFNVRTLCLHHRVQLGLSVPTSTLLAIADAPASPTPTSTSATSHPPLPLHACELLGYLIDRHVVHRAGGSWCNTWRARPGSSSGEARHVAKALASLQNAAAAADEGEGEGDGEGGGGASPWAYLQSCALLTLYFWCKGEMGRSREVFGRASARAVECVRRLRVLREEEEGEGTEDFGFKLAPTTRGGEIQAALAQVVYLDLSYMIIRELPSLLDPGVYAFFGTLVTSRNAQMESNFVRAKSAFCWVEARSLIKEWNRCTLAEPALSAWQSAYWALTETLTAHRSLLMLTLARIALHPELRALLLTLKVCAIITMTALIELVSVFCSAQGERELRQTQRGLVVEIVGVSLGFGEGDWGFLDPILTECWTVVIASVDTCLTRGTYEYGDTMHDLPGMAQEIRQRYKKLQRALPFNLDKNKIN